MDKLGLKNIIVQIDKTTNYRDILKIFYRVTTCIGTAGHPHTANELIDHLGIIKVLFYVLLFNDDDNETPPLESEGDINPSFDNLKSGILHILFSLHDEIPSDEKLSE